MVTVFAVLVTSCVKKEASVSWWQREKERIELSHQLALKEMRFQQLDSQILPRLEELRQSNQSMATSIQSLKLRKIAAGNEVESLENQFSGFKQSVLTAQRNRSQGRTFAALATLSGRTYQNVVVASIDDAGVTIRHANGSARLRYDDLDANQRLLFGLDGVLAAAATQRESSETAAYERWTDEQLLVQNAKKEKRADAALRDELMAQQNRRLAAARQVVAAETRPLAQPARSFNSGSSRYYSSYRSYRPFYRYVSYTPSYCNTPIHCSPGFTQSCAPVTRYPAKHPTPSGGGSGRKSFADTTIPSIP